MANPIVLLAVVAGAVVVIGSGALDGIGSALKGILPSGGGGAASTEVSNTTVIETFTNPLTGEENVTSVNVGAGSTIVANKINQSSIVQKKEEALLLGRQNLVIGGQGTLSDSVRFFRELQNLQQSQTSRGTSVILSEADIRRIVSKQLTRTQQADAAKLDARRAGSKFPNFKLSGEDTVLLKALEAERARIGLFDSRSVTNPNFNLGLPSNASKADIELAIRQQNENRIRLARNEQIKINRDTNIQIGNIIIKATGTQTLARQKQVFTQLNISGGSALNAKAIGRLQELGFITL